LDWNHPAAYHAGKEQSEFCKLFLRLFVGEDLSQNGTLYDQRILAESTANDSSTILNELFDR
jgi:hypothetical protein